MSSRVVKKIADKYWVTRSIPGVCPDWGAASGIERWEDHHRNLIANAINATKWQPTLLKRADQCKKLVENISEAMAPSIKSTRKKAVSFASGVTKLSWFDQPLGEWTLFDKYARRAVMGTSNDDALETMVEFYQILADRKFTAVQDAIMGATAEMQIELYPGKIIDHFLMASCPLGGETKTDFGKGNQTAGEVLSRRLISQAREILDACAARVKEILLDSDLIRSRTPRGRPA